MWLIRKDLSDLTSRNLQRQFLHRISKPKHAEYVHIDSVESAGEYARRLDYTNNLSCRFCGDPAGETIPHLLTDCVGTSAYRSEHDLCLNTLTNESTSSLLKVARFDSWIRRTVNYDTRPPDYRIQSTLNQLEEQKKRKSDDEQCDVRPRKRNCLVIPDSSLKRSSSLVSTRVRKIRRIE